MSKRLADAEVGSFFQQNKSAAAAVASSTSIGARASLPDENFPMQQHYPLVHDLSDPDVNSIGAGSDVVKTNSRAG